MLDAALVRRRAELGLSARTVATHLKVSPNVVIAIEAGTNHAELSLAHLHRLADVLSVEVTTLLLAARPAPEAEGGPAATDDVAQLGAVLQATGVLTPLDSLTPNPSSGTQSASRRPWTPSRGPCRPSGCDFTAWVEASL